MNHQLRIFFTALMFYTRIPCPPNIDHSPEYINKATRFFPLIGWIVGAISFAFFWLAQWLLGPSVAVLVSLVAGVLTTGAFHEDGLADVADGFGGGWTREKILEIMKDSRVGAYGAIALILLFLAKFLALNHLIGKIGPQAWGLLAGLLVAYHALARLAAVTIVFTSAYAREDETSKARPIAQTHTYREVLGAVFFGLLPLAGLAIWIDWKFVGVLLPLLLLVGYARRYFNRWLGGYTGDCLGAVEQASEVTILFAFLAIVDKM